MECMYAQTRPPFILSSERVSGGNGVRIHVNSKGKIPSTRKILLRGGWNPRRCIKQDSQPNTLSSYSSPLVLFEMMPTEILISPDTRHEDELGVQSQSKRLLIFIQVIMTLKDATKDLTTHPS